jgi:hypothetical protein
VGGGGGGGGAHSLTGEGWGSPSSDEGTCTVVLRPFIGRGGHLVVDASSNEEVGETQRHHSQDPQIHLLI